MPRRARSLLGLARAHAAAGDKKAAAEQYRELMRVWHGREELPGYQEAKEFLAGS